MRQPAVQELETGEVRIILRAGAQWDLSPEEACRLGRRLLDQGRDKGEEWRRFAESLIAAGLLSGVATG